MENTSALEAYISKLKEISKQLITELNNIVKNLNQLARLMVQNLDEYEWRCQVMLEDHKNNGRNFDISQASRWTLPKLLINDKLKFENIFQLEGISDQFLAESEKITSCVYHPETTTKKLKCRSKHCIECLRELLKSNIDLCPCGKQISMKDKKLIFSTPNVFHRKLIVNS